MITLQTYERTPLLAELKVSYRRSLPRGKTPPVAINSTYTCEKYLRSIWHDDTMDLREEVVLVCLTQSLRAAGWVRVAEGGMSHAAVDPRIIFGIALQTASAGIVLAHNHPSGDPTPSPEDIEVTRRLAAGSRLLGLRLVEHMILTRNSVYCFSETEYLAA